MENLNLPPFYVGQKVVYITGETMPKNSVHTVTRIKKTSCCGIWLIQIGSNSGYIRDELYFVCDCNKVFLRNDVPYIWDANSFRPLEELLFPSLTMKEVVKKESQLVSLN